MLQYIYEGNLNKKIFKGDRKVITLYLDCDDTILNSSEVIIDILNRKYGQTKTLDDLKDYRYRSIANGVTQQEILEIYQSEEFWEKVQFNPDFLAVAKKLKNYFKFVIVTKGTQKNLMEKEIHLHKAFEALGFSIDFIGLPLSFNPDTSIGKNLIQMQNGIQIDDCAKELVNSSAAMKILLKNNRETYWNETPCLEENMYAAQNWKEIEEILNFTLKHDEMLAVL